MRSYLLEVRDNADLEVREAFLYYTPLDSLKAKRMLEIIETYGYPS